MKQILIVILMLSNIFLMATKEKISINSDEVELSFENVNVDELVFSEENEGMSASFFTRLTSRIKILTPSLLEDLANASYWLPCLKSCFSRAERSSGSLPT